jgi:hypothetical protein
VLHGCGQIVCNDDPGPGKVVVDRVGFALIGGMKSNLAVQACPSDEEEIRLFQEPFFRDGTIIECTPGAKDNFSFSFACKKMPKGEDYEIPGKEKVEDTSGRDRPGEFVPPISGN